MEGINEIFVPGIVADGETLAAGEMVIFTIKGVQNQNSAKDAGSYEISTWEFYEGDYYMVDKTSSETSYTALPGKIVAVGVVEVDNP